EARRTVRGTTAVPDTRGGGATSAGSDSAAPPVPTDTAPLPAAVIPVPREIDYAVARLRLAAMGVRHDTLSDAQRAYLADFEK
ncbi:MAG: hypothetical protein ACLFSV_08410, partial [Alkalispirochaeta sp.]